MRKLAMIFATVLLVFSLQVPVFANEGMTRGEFFKLVADHLNAETANVAVETPSDVPHDSPYANAVKVLIAKDILKGYGSNKVGVNDPLLPEHASFILARVFGIADENAVAELRDTFGISLGDGNVVDEAVAKEVVAKLLKSDEEVVELSNAVNELLIELQSYHIDGTIDVAMKIDEAFQQEFGDILAGLDNMSMQTAIDYHVTDGMRQVVTTEIDGVATEMVQYIIPEGFITGATNPFTGEMEWMNMSELMPFTFEELIELQEQSVFINQQFNDEYFYYKDLGTEVIDGVAYKKIGTYGTIDSMIEIFEQLSGVMPGTDLLAVVNDVPDMKIIISGTVLVNEETKLPVKQQMTMTIQYEEATDLLPITEMSISMDLAFSQFNEIDGIDVPEAALNAPSLFEGIDIPEEFLIDEEIPAEEAEEIVTEEEQATEEEKDDEVAMEEDEQVVDEEKDVTEEQQETTDEEIETEE